MRVCYMQRLRLAVTVSVAELNKRAPAQRQSI